MDCQDWTEVRIKRKSDAVKKQHTTVASSVATASRIERSDEPVKTKKLSSEGLKKIIQARLERKMTQADLNKECAFVSNTIRDIESGKTQPTGNQLNILNRVLRLQISFER